MLGTGNSFDIQGGDAGPATSGDAKGGVLSSGRTTVSIATGGRGSASVQTSDLSGWLLLAAVVGGAWWLSRRK